MSLDASALAVFAPSWSRGLGEAVCHALHAPLERLEERDFEDGEHHARLLEPVRGKDVYVLASLHGDAALLPDAKLGRLAFLLGTLRDGDPRRLTAVVPYLCYARQERRSAAGDPIATRYVAAMLEAVGLQRIVTVHVHDRAAFENAFRIPSVDLETADLFVRYLVSRLGSSELAVVSPDAGGVAAAERLRVKLERALGRAVSSGFLSKVRGPSGLRSATFAGEVQGRLAIVVDDVVASGATLVRAAEACRAHGATGVVGVVTHGLFAGDAGRLLAGPALERVFVTSSVEPWRIGPGLARAKIEVVDLAPALAETIERLAA